MKSFKVREGKMKVDGVYYSDTPSDNVIMGKMGKIHSISISGKQFFPYAGQFNDGTIKTVDSTTEVMDTDTKVEKKKRAKKGSK
jgi:hypothetical protein